MIDALAKSVIEDIRSKHAKKGKQQGFARDGWVIVVPRGERVLDVEGGYRMRTRLRDEYLGLVAAFERGIEVRQEEDGVPIAPWEKP